MMATTTDAGAEGPEKIYMRWLTLYGLAIAFLAAACCPAQAKSVVLQHSYKAGQIDKYRMSLDTKMSMPEMPAAAAQNMRVKMSVLLTQKVLGLLPDGSAKVKMSYSNLKIESPDMPDTRGASIPPVAMTLVISRTGQIVSIEDPGQGTGMPGLDMSSLAGQFGYYGIFPDTAIEVGQMWRSVVPLPFGSGDMRVDFELLAAAIPIGKEVASKIKQTYEAYMDLGEMMKGAVASGGAPAIAGQMGGGMHMRGWSVLYFSPNKGKLIKANGSVNALMSVQMPASAVQQGAPGRMNMQMDMTLNLAKV